ncbi:MAG TPA: 16S rRNA (cytidine(1402)-2'-O)-methyltransferase [Candidatus Atribacteria bacterium]|nr:16S rRNA (cytidine(1402)-2'-O)-methyltransferase [Candidatus Atribacteria bacterium]
METVKEWGKLYFCPTPLGNLQDITLRTLQVFREVDFIACEDTRVTLKILNHYHIQKPLFSYHSYNLKEVSSRIVNLLKGGKNIALVSDAGMPGIQDPGMELVNILEKEGLSFEVLPGPSALVVAVVYSGFAFSGFTFLGFLPRKKKERRGILERLLHLPQAMVIYESPHRVVSTLEEIKEMVGSERRVIFLRELTKIHEEILRGKLDEISEILSQREEIKGEVVLVIEGEKREKQIPLEAEKLIKALSQQGIAPRQILEVVSNTFSISKNRLKEVWEKEKLS